MLGWKNNGSSNEYWELAFAAAARRAGHREVAAALLACQCGLRKGAYTTHSCAQGGGHWAVTAAVYNSAGGLACLDLRRRLGRVAPGSVLDWLQVLLQPRRHLLRARPAPNRWLVSQRRVGRCGGVGTHGFSPSRSRCTADLQSRSNRPVAQTHSRQQPEEHAGLHGAQQSGRWSCL